VNEIINGIFLLFLLGGEPKHRHSQDQINTTILKKKSPNNNPLLKSTYDTDCMYDRETEAEESDVIGRTLFPKTITVLPLFKLPTHWSSLPMDIKDNDGIPFAYLWADEDETIVLNRNLLILTRLDTKPMEA
jgi:hypothetical protein